MPTQLLVISKPVLWRMLALQQTMALNLLHVLARRIRENNTVLLGSLELQRLYRSKAETDALTGLHNRAWFEEIFPKQLELCERTGQNVSLLMVDIDHFKKVNDVHGHSAGDLVLQSVARTLSACVRPMDTLARYGGEEFAVVLPGIDSEGARLVAQRIRDAVRHLAIPHAPSPFGVVTVSIGVASGMPHPDVQHEALVKTADTALYQAKHAGRDRAAVESLTPLHF